jgi:hypothetical protein
MATQIRQDLRKGIRLRIRFRERQPELAHRDFQASTDLQQLQPDRGRMKAGTIGPPLRPKRWISSAFNRLRATQTKSTPVQVKDDLLGSDFPCRRVVAGLFGFSGIACAASNIALILFLSGRRPDHCVESTGGGTSGTGFCVT